MATVRGRRPARRGAGAGGVILLALLAVATPAGAERIDLDLYERISLAPLVVRGAIDGDPQRLARVRVLEVLKGEYSGSHLEVAYRLINFERPYGQEKIAFEAGEEAFLFLVPQQNARGQVPRPDRFILFKGPDGKITLPAEGRQAWLDAARRLAEVCGRTDSRELFEALRRLTREDNPILVEVGLRQVRKHALQDDTLVPVLLELIRRPDGRFRAEALEIAADLLRQPPRPERPLAVRDHLLGLATTLADEAPEVATRRAAVRLLASEGTPSARAKLESISKGDPSQDVRYEAALAVYRLRSAGPAPALLSAPLSTSN